MSIVTPANAMTEDELAGLGITPEMAAKFGKLAKHSEDVVQAYLAACRDDDAAIEEGLDRWAARHTVAPAPAYRTSPTKRPRRSKADIQAIRDEIENVLAEEQPMTVRQVYYQLVSRGVIDKTEAEYKGTVCRLLADMRTDGTIPFGWIGDNTRWQRKPQTHRSLDHMLALTRETYRRALWNDQGVRVEVWLEKDALAGVLYDVTAEFDVPLMVTRGYPSLSYLYESAEYIRDVGKPCHLFYFGDFDPSGVDIPRTVEAGLRKFAPDAEIYFERVAVTQEQIASLRLPTRPTKTTDTRAKNFEGESVEVDAIPPKRLRQLVRDCIEQHIDYDRLAATERTEEAERETLQMISDALRDGGVA